MSGWMDTITKSGGSYSDQPMQSLGGLVGSLASYDQAKNNARYMKAQRKNALREAENSAAAHKRQYEQIASSQKAGFGANGVDVNEGSPVEAMAATDGEGATGAKQIQYTGEMEALDWKLREKNAKQKQRMAVINGAATASGIWQKSGTQNFWTGFKNSGGGRTLGDM